MSWIKPTLKLGPNVDVTKVSSHTILCHQICTVASKLPQVHERVKESSMQIIGPGFWKAIVILVFFTNEKFLTLMNDFTQLMLFWEIIGSYSGNDKKPKNTPCEPSFKIKTGGKYS